MISKRPLFGALLIFIGTQTFAQTPGNIGKLQSSDRSAILFQDDFQNGDQWLGEFEEAGELRFAKGMIDIVAPKGATLWFRPKLSGPLEIEYQVQAVAEGGPFDRVSDLNCFFMATDPLRPKDFFSPARSGKFEDYNTLRMYYVGLGGNRNTTTRFRRYIGDPQERPLLPENDRSQPQDMIQPNAWQTIRITVHGSDIRYFRDDVKLFHYDDPAPYREGWFGLRTTLNHMRVRNFRVYRLN